MSLKRILLSICCMSCALPFVEAQTYESNWESLNKRAIPTWFQDSKFGIFIHWGIYAVPAIAKPGGYAEWYWHALVEKDDNAFTQTFHNKEYGSSVSYMDFERSFKPSLFNPEHWAQLFKNSGARYVVLTSKHHDGYCLWDNPQADQVWGRPWNAVTGTPKRDLLGDLTKAVRAAGMRMGFYYSLYEWYNPIWLKDRNQYVKDFMFPQFKDLVNRYEPSIIFSDGEWSMSDTAWHSTELLAWLYNESSVKRDVVVNDRWGKGIRGKHANTYATSEYGSGMGPEVIWEENRGIGNSFGYNRLERLEDYKSNEDLVFSLVDIVSRGGNLLLNVGPTADGRIPVIMEERLQYIGQWLQKNGAAIYETRPYKNYRQWSPGKQPEVKKGNYATHYDVMDLLRANDSTAHIELFFTQKQQDLFVIVPQYQKQIRLRQYTKPAAAKVYLLASGAEIKGFQQGEDYLLYLSGFSPVSIDARLIVIQIKQGAQ